MLTNLSCHQDCCWSPNHSCLEGEEPNLPMHPQHMPHLVASPGNNKDSFRIKCGKLSQKVFSLQLNLQLPRLTKPQCSALKNLGAAQNRFSKLSTEQNVYKI